MKVGVSVVGRTRAAWPEGTERTFLEASHPAILKVGWARAAVAKRMDRIGAIISRPKEGRGRKKSCDETRVRRVVTADSQTNLRHLYTQRHSSFAYGETNESSPLSGPHLQASMRPAFEPRTESPQSVRCWQPQDRRSRRVHCLVDNP